MLSHMGMNTRSCYKHPMNRVALYYFIAAVVSFLAYHFVPLSSVDRGWMVWRGLFNFVRGGWHHADAEDLISHSLWLWMTLQSLTGPFLVPFFIGSKLIRWLILCPSTMMFIGLSCLFLVKGQLNHYSPFLWVLASQGFHFVGCLCIRRPQPEEFIPAPHPDA